MKRLKGDRLKSLIKKTLIAILLIVILNFSVIHIKKSSLQLTTHKQQIKGDKMKITSVFEHNGNIPSIYTCDGQDLAPELLISGVPAEAKELALIVDDPDAPIGTWVHWVLYNIPVNITKIDEKNLPQGVKQGRTDFGRVGWGGPCPPNGEHRYFFKLYAIDKILELPLGATKEQVEHAIHNHIIESTELIGLYKRK